MQSKTKTQTGGPPKLIPALQAGFNDITSHIYLILFPILLDLFLWLGPRFSVKTVAQPFMEAWITSIGRVGTPDLQSFMAANQEVFDLFLEQFNLASALRTFPIGIPSLMSSSLGANTPFGTAMVIEGSSLFEIMVALVCFLVGGLIVGSLYFTSVARVSLEEKKGYSGGVIIAHVIQTFLLTAALFLILLAIAIPSLLILTIFGMIAPGLAQFGGLLMFFILLWLILPLVFSPHGIFGAGLNAFTSVYTSVRLVRFFLPGTGTFLVASLVLNEGMNILWHIPDNASWMTLVGILGHGFIATSLLSASFAYYQGGMKWMSENLTRLMKTETKAV